MSENNLPEQNSSAVRGCAPATCSADAFATALTALTAKYIEKGLTPEQAAAVFTHAADTALDYLKWEPTLTRMLHKQIKTVAGLMRHHWMPSPPNASNSATGDRGASPANADGKA